MAYTKVITCICKHCLKDLGWRSLFLLLLNTAGRVNENHLSSQPVEDLHWGKSTPLASRSFQAWEGPECIRLLGDCDILIYSQPLLFALTDY